MTPPLLVELILISKITFTEWVTGKSSIVGMSADVFC